MANPIRIEGVDHGKLDDTTLSALRVVLISGGGTQDVVRGASTLLNSGVLSGDTAIKTSAGEVYWMTMSDISGLSIELNDSISGAGTDVWALDLPAGGYAHFIFDPPIECDNGIYLDVTTVSCKVTVGYK